MTDTFPELCQRFNLPRPEPEYQFAKDIGRRWRIDYAFLKERVALEIEGGIWVQGRHTRGSGFAKDIDKYNTLAILGWRLLRVTPKQMKNGEVFLLLERALK